MLNKAPSRLGGAFSSKTGVGKYHETKFHLIDALLLALVLTRCGNSKQEKPSVSAELNQAVTVPADSTFPKTAPPEDFMLIDSGTFQMGSPESEPRRSEDESIHAVTLSGFYISRYEVTQAEYQAIMGENPSIFTGDDFPIDRQNVSWDRSANGYQMFTKAEWEHACPAGTDTPFNTETSISAGEANYWVSIPISLRIPIRNFHDGLTFGTILRQI